MPGKTEIDDCHVECGEQILFPPQSSSYSHHQPLWHGAGESSSKYPSADQLNGSFMNGAMSSLSNEEGLADGIDFSEQRPMVFPSLSGGGVEEEYQNMKQPMFSTTFFMDKHLVPSPHMEHFGHSAVLTPPCSHAHYGQVLTPYGQQVMMNPPSYGVLHARMPLPLKMEDEPVYVNAKQYHGILRRRQSRAKAELDKKVTKNRKPYLHESRHLHAMRRARGIGGRFINTKKLEDNNSNATSSQANNAGANSSSTDSFNTQHLLTNSENLSSLKSAVQDMHRMQNFNLSYHNGNGVTTLYHSQANGKREEDYFDIEKDPSEAFK